MKKRLIIILAAVLITGATANADIRSSVFGDLEANREHNKLHEEGKNPHGDDPASAEDSGGEGSAGSRPIKEYNIPELPKPEGLPGLSGDQLDTPEDARQYFIADLLPRVTKMLIILIGLASFIMLLVSGFTYFTTFGESDKADSAKRTAIYALVGVIVAMLSFAIVQIIGSLPFV